jgi:hypothetical protein
MNKNKAGKKYKFPDLLILFIDYIRVYSYLPCRQTEEIIKATGKSLPSHPTSYSQICRRINELDIASNRLDDNASIIIAIDGNGISYE